jgi:hypothetical protein
MGSGTPTSFSSCSTPRSPVSSTPGGPIRQQLTPLQTSTQAPSDINLRLPLQASTHAPANIRHQANYAPPNLHLRPNQTSDIEFTRHEKSAHALSFEVTFVSQEEQRHPCKLLLLCVEAVLEATRGQMDNFFSQLPCKCHLEEVASMRD